MGKLHPGSMKQASGLKPAWKTFWGHIIDHSWTCNWDDRNEMALEVSWSSLLLPLLPSRKRRLTLLYKISFAALPCVIQLRHQHCHNHVDIEVKMVWKPKWPKGSEEQDPTDERELVFQNGHLQTWCACWSSTINTSNPSSRETETHGPSSSENSALSMREQSRVTSYVTCIWRSIISATMKQEYLYTQWNAEYSLSQLN